METDSQLHGSFTLDPHIVIRVSKQTEIMLAPANELVNCVVVRDSDTNVPIDEEFAFGVICTRSIKPGEELFLDPRGYIMRQDIGKKEPVLSEPAGAVTSVNKSTQK